MRALALRVNRTNIVVAPVNNFADQLVAEFPFEGGTDYRDSTRIE